MAEHVNDPWVKEATRLRLSLARGVQADRARRTRTSCSGPGMRVVDLGAAPGSWTQVLREQLGRDGHDRRDRPPADGRRSPACTFVQADFREDDGLAALESALGGAQARPCGFGLVPQSLRRRGGRSGAVGASWASWRSNLPRPGCNPAAISSSKRSRAKASRSSGARWRQHFGKVYVRKPKASRDRSREVYLVGKGPQNLSVRRGVRRRLSPEGDMRAGTKLAVSPGEGIESQAPRRIRAASRRGSVQAGGRRPGTCAARSDIEQSAQEHRHLARHRPRRADRRQAVRRAPGPEGLGPVFGVHGPGQGRQRRVGDGRGPHDQVGVGRQEAVRHLQPRRHLDGRRPRQVRRQGRGQARGGAELPRADLHLVVPDAAPDRRVDLLHAPDAGRRARRRVLASARARPRSSTSRTTRSPSPTSPAATRRRRKSARSSSSCAIRPSSRSWAAASRAAC